MQTPLSPQDWHRAGTRIDFKGRQIFTAAFGSGESTPILTLHGFPTASHDYARMVPLLADRRVIAFDMLGYGFSDKPRDHDYSLFEQADITEVVAAHYGISACALLSHDMGDSVALELLRRANAGALSFRVTHVILMNGSVLLKYYHPLITQRLLLNPITGALISRLGLIGRRSFASQFGSLFATPLTPTEIDDFWGLVTINGGTHIYHRLIRYLNERKRHEGEWLDALAAHPAPLTVIWGQRDPVSVPRIAEAVIERRGDARYLKLDHIGHYPQWEVPGVVAAAVKDALR